ERVCSGDWRSNAFRKYCTLAEFVYTLPDPIADPLGFDMYAEGGSEVLDEVYRMLVRTRCENIFPSVVCSPVQWSFENGIYNAKQDRFWAYADAATYEDVDSPFVQNIFSACYIPSAFRA